MFLYPFNNNFNLEAGLSGMRNLDREPEPEYNPHAPVKLGIGMVATGLYSSIAFCQALG